MISVASALFGLRTPELIGLLVILLVFFGSPLLSAPDGIRDRCCQLTRQDFQILIFIGAITAIGIAILVWQRLAM